MYHQVGRFSLLPWKTHGAEFCDVNAFRRQMRFLRRAGYTVVSVETMCRGVRGEVALPAKPVALTFDDGFQNFADCAWPILQEMGYPATVYLVSQSIGKDADWLKSNRPRSPLMDIPTLHRLLAEGVTFGSHGRTHRRFAVLGEEERREEVLGSKYELENILGCKIKDFCYPYGNYDEPLRDLVKSVGYCSAMTCIQGATHFAENVFELPRKAIDYWHTLAGFYWKLAIQNKPYYRARYNPEHIRVKH